MTKRGHGSVYVFNNPNILLGNEIFQFRSHVFWKYIIPVRIWFERDARWAGKTAGVGKP